MAFAVEMGCQEPLSAREGRKEVPDTFFLAVLAFLLLVPVVGAQDGPSGDVPRPVAASRAAELLANAERTRAAGGEDQAAAALVGFEQAAAWAAQGRAPEIYARARLGKALCLRDLSQPVDALEALDEAVATARSARLRELLVELLDEQALTSHAIGRLDRAVLAVREAALVRDELGRVQEAVTSLLRLAELELERGGPRAAGPALEAALERARSAGLPGAVEAVLEAQAELALLSGDVGRARRAADELMGERAEGPDGSTPTAPLVLLARTLIAAGQREESVPMLRDAATACAEVADRACEAEAREVLAANLLGLGRPREAVQEVLPLVGLRRGQGDSAGEIRAQIALVRAFVQLGRLEAASGALSEANALAERGSSPAVRAALAVEAARLLFERRLILEAVEAWDEALRLAARPGEAPSPGFAAPTDLAVPPSLEDMRRRQLDVLVEAGLWGRALEACPSCVAGGGLEAMRDTVRTQAAPLLAWQALDDSLLAWVLLADGRLHGSRLDGMGATALSALAHEVKTLAPQVPIDLSVDGDEQGEENRADDEAEELRRALRRLHDALFATVEHLMPEEGRALLVRPCPELQGLPWGLLLDPDGAALGRTLAIAELPSTSFPPGPGGTGDLRVVADLRDPEHPGMDMRRLIAREEAAMRRRADEAPAPEPEPGRRRDALGRPRLPVAPATDALVAPGERRYEEGLVILAGDASVPRRFDELATQAAVLVAHVDCERFESPEGLPGPVAALPSCFGEAAREAAAGLLEAGARAVFVLDWHPGEAAAEALAAGLVAGLSVGAEPAEALRSAAQSGLPTNQWGALRLIGGLR